VAKRHKKKEREAWDRFADAGRAALVGAASLLPQGAGSNRRHISAGECLLAIKVITELLKKAVPERRPDGDNDKSFPSEHAAECVAAAIIIEREYPGKVGALAFALATAVSLARIESKKHYPRDVLAGALIGCAGVWLSLQMRLTSERMLNSG
jgi:membrane-associated phospholipid phosphatase